MSYRRKRPVIDHTDDWLMTYADMITLLLCFFAIFLSVSVPKKELLEKIQIMKEQLQEEKKKEKDLLEGDLPFHGVPRVVVKTQPLPVIATPPVPEKPKGDRITIFEMSSGAFFDVGSATLNDSGKAILKDLTGKLQSADFSQYAITVEGHTDDSPIATPQFPSNWELSTARASAVVHFFLELGIPAQRLRAAGYADTFPKVPNRDADGKAIPQNQAQNRRVVIKLEKIDRDSLKQSN